ncbi:hypothetical protein [Paenibacillus radicis (ex Gao et al. 2016)]|uniref:Uncharacterized protein n=1 Tax=Paenibacillus radicis (ex Gao et al. 2016) TaxID=1737354 RepID=A0A917MAU8_9BACL|nr:hypothetical protein [Paenibacillus radicis (ex Gao et al. 2016)]GGG88722.1 hypothetical protein GCM10010918_54180 [Paenibacillus radicis (ex Gao et al. 2016)]
MKTSFRLYRKNASFFDLIDGDNETKQTKGLAYLFSEFPELIVHFILHIPGCPRLKDIDYVQVDAELVSTGSMPIRRDITLTFVKGRIKKFALIIEAKSIKVTAQYQAIEAQLSSYLDRQYFPMDEGVPKIGITLTKNRVMHKPEMKFISMTWFELIGILVSFLRKHSMPEYRIINEYIDFLRGVDKEMHYYEIEVLSVAAGKTYELTKIHGIHACPDSNIYKTPIYITFRMAGGGEMEYLYKIRDIVVFDPTMPSLSLMLEGLDPEFAMRIKGYVSDRSTGAFGFEKDEPYRFYYLDVQNAIHLPHHPKPEKNNTGPRYYSIASCIKGEKIIQVVSKE